MGGTRNNSQRFSSTNEGKKNKQKDKKKNEIKRETSARIPLKID